MKDRLKRSVERERTFEKPIEKFSRLLWPWQESKLVLSISLMAALDYLTTFAALRLTRSNQVMEVGPIAKWALQSGGFLNLFFVDMAIISILLLLASGAQFLYTRFGFPGFGRAAFVFLLIPYATFIIAVVINNVLATYLGLR